MHLAAVLTSNHRAEDEALVTVLEMIIFPSSLSQNLCPVSFLLAAVALEEELMMRAGA